MILTILFVVTMFLWGLSLVPFPRMEPFSSGRPFLAFVAVLLLGLFLFVPGLR